MRFILSILVRIKCNGGGGGGGWGEKKKRMKEMKKREKGKERKSILARFEPLISDRGTSSLTTES